MKENTFGWVLLAVAMICFALGTVNRIGNLEWYPFLEATTLWRASMSLALFAIAVGVLGRHARRA